MSRELQDAARELRQMASKLESIEAEICLPITTDCTVAEGLQKLRSALGPDKSFSIGFEIDHGSDGLLNLEWKVWDAKTFHRASTLAAAVNMCLAVHAPPAADPIASVHEALAESA